MRRLVVALALLAAASALADEPPSTSATVEQQGPAPGAPLTGALRTGLYLDGDQTVVFRALGALAGGIGHWLLDANVSADVVSSASVDVRASPLGRVDVTTSASGRTNTSGGHMSDRRLAATLGGGWNDGRGHAMHLSVSGANERDYNSLGVGWNGSIDLFDRMTTLLGGVSFTQNWIGSTLDPSFARQMYAFGWTVGGAQVLGRHDALRLRYDGSAANGYQASPYRWVRFGDWVASSDPTTGQITFSNTIGSPDGVAETEPNLRVRHAVTVEWVHSFREGLALRLEGRGGTDSWGVNSVAAGAELRFATYDWRLRGGYRFYGQTHADFYQSKYLAASTRYQYFTSDKELGDELGHVVTLGVSRVLHHPRTPGRAPLLLDVTATVLHYDYPGYVLLSSRTSGFLELGLTWE